MSLKQLQQIIPPPADPIYPGGYSDWTKLKSRPVPELPKSLFDITEHYGSGRFFQGSLEVMNPFDPDYQRFVDQKLAALKLLREQTPEYYPYAPYPEELGVLPFGHDDNGNLFFWLTTGKVDSWSIVCNSESGYWEKPIRHKVPDFLLLLVTNKLDIKNKNFWGNKFSKDDYNFRPKALKRSGKKKS